MRHVAMLPVDPTSGKPGDLIPGPASRLASASASPGYNSTPITGLLGRFNKTHFVSRPGYRLKIQANFYTCICVFFFFFPSSYPERTWFGVYLIPELLLLQTPGTMCMPTGHMSHPGKAPALVPALGREVELNLLPLLSSHVTIPVPAHTEEAQPRGPSELSLGQGCAVNSRLT
ncbi:hypothetical protein VULLAG_LOCUS14649 [Vulpes lagopus]